MQSSIPVEVLAAALTLVTAPLLADLVISLVGNLFHPRKAHGEARRPTRLAVVVPAHDQESTVTRTVLSLIDATHAARAANAPDGIDVEPWKVPIFVVAHNCSDETAAAAAAAGAFVIELNKRMLQGKGAVLRTGFFVARAVGANAFLVVDADSVVSPNLIAATLSTLEAGAPATQCRCELELPRFTRPTASDRLRALAFRGVNVLRARGRARLGFSAGIFGNGFALTEETLARAPFWVGSICEDLEYHIRLVAAALRVEWVEDAVVSAPLICPRSARAAQEARWEGGRFHVATHCAGRLLSAAIKGNWRALETLAEATSLPLSRGVLALLLMALLPVAWLHLFAIAAGVVMLIYVLEAAKIGGQIRKDLAALVAAPFYILWKLAITPMVLRQTREGAEWTPTRREANVPW